MDMIRMSKAEKAAIVREMAQASAVPTPPADTAPESTDSTHYEEANPTPAGAVFCRNAGDLMRIDPADMHAMSVFIQFTGDRPDLQLLAIRRAERIRADAFSSITTEEGQLLALDKLETEMLGATRAEIREYLLGAALTEKVRQKIEERYPAESPAPDAAGTGTQTPEPR